MDGPIAFFLTITGYGTWLPGDARGWVEYRRGWQLPNPAHELEASASLMENACVLNQEEREIVECQISETCDHRGWILHAAKCRSNHLHAVISAADTKPQTIRVAIKAWCTRRLRELSDPTRANWWAERGSIRWIFTLRSLETVIQYVNEAQDRKAQEQISPTNLTRSLSQPSAHPNPKR